MRNQRRRRPELTGVTVVTGDCVTIGGVRDRGGEVF